MKKMIPLLLTLCILLTGCSSGYNPQSDVTFDFKDGYVSYKGNPLKVDEYKGYIATKTTPDQIGGQYTLMLDTAKDVTNITWNTQQILEENMDKYKGCFFYREYLGSQNTMAKSLGNDTWAVVQGFCERTTEANVIMQFMYDYLDSTPLTNGQIYVKCDGFTFGNSYDQVILRPSEAVIPGIAKLSVGTYNTTDTVSIVQDKKEIQLQHGASTKYDYYVYNGYLIQVLKGMDISNYVVFK